MKARLAAAMAALALVMTAASAGASSITYPYTAHVQEEGWQDMVGDGATAGTTGQGLRLEALRFVFPGQEARGHVQDLGWQAWQAGDSTQIGTIGKSKRLEAVQVSSTNPGAAIECQAYVQNIGWMPRVPDGQVCGTTGKGLRLEAVRFWLVENN